MFDTIMHDETLHRRDLARIPFQVLRRVRAYGARDPSLAISRWRRSRWKWQWRHRRQRRRWGGWWLWRRARRSGGWRREGLEAQPEGGGVATAVIHETVGNDGIRRIRSDAKDHICRIRVWCDDILVARSLKLILV